MTSKTRQNIQKKGSSNVKGRVRTTKFQKKEKNGAEVGSEYSRSDERYQPCLRSLRISKYDKLIETKKHYCQTAEYQRILKRKKEKKNPTKRYFLTSDKKKQLLFNNNEKQRK